MNTMKSFYASISFAARLGGSYLEALSEITKMSPKQISSIQSDLAWQDWSQPNQSTAATEV